MARLPAAIPLLGILSLAVLVLQGAVWRRGLAPIVAFFAVCLTTSGIATLLAPSGALNGYFVMAASFALLGAAVLFSGSVGKNLGVVLGATYVGLWFHFVLSFGELVSGIKILPLRDPRASTVPVILADPWAVTSLFVNYNDYSVAMAIFAALLVAKLGFSTGQARWRTVAQWAALVLTCLIVVMIGSRGALVALIVTVALELILLVRFRHPDLITTRRLWALVGVGGVGFLVAWNSPYFQNHSTEWRGQIIENIFTMLFGSPIRLFLGYGSSTAYHAAAAIAYPGQLMDPHNVFVELILAYGVFGLIAFLGVIGWVFVRGLMGQQLPRNQIGVAAVTTGLGLVLYGTVPSGFLDYGYPCLFAITAAAAVWWARQASLFGAATPVQSGQPDGGEESQGQGSAAHNQEADHR